MKKFIWLLRRELWERRSLWAVPLMLAATLVVLAGVSFLRHGSVALNVGSVTELAQLNAQLTGARIDGVTALMLLALAGPFIVAALVMQTLYALEAVAGERKDRSILFWRSLPFSDREAVAAKFVVALVVIPVLAAVAALITQIGVFAIASLGVHDPLGFSHHLWSGAAWRDYAVVMLAVTGCGIVWNAPLVAASLLISAAVRSPVFFATLFPLACAMAEGLTLGSHHVSGFIMDRTFGLLPRLFGADGASTYDLLVGDKTLTLPQTVGALVHPIEFLAAPEAWGGVLVAVPLLVAAAWMRGVRDLGELRDLLLPAPRRG